MSVLPIRWSGRSFHSYPLRRTDRSSRNVMPSAFMAAGIISATRLSLWEYATKQRLVRFCCAALCGNTLLLPRRVTLDTDGHGYCFDQQILDMEGDTSVCRLPLHLICRIGKCLNPECEEMPILKPGEGDCLLRRPDGDQPDSILRCVNCASTHHSS